MNKKKSHPKDLVREDFSSVNLGVAVPLRWGQENAVATQWPSSVFLTCQAFCSWC